MNGDEHARVRFSTWYKDSETLQKDREFDDEKSRIVNRGRDINPLRRLWVRVRIVDRWRAYMKHFEKVLDSHIPLMYSTAVFGRQKTCRGFCDSHQLRPSEAIANICFEILTHPKMTMSAQHQWSLHGMGIETYNPQKRFCEEQTTWYTDAVK